MNVRLRQDAILRSLRRTMTSTVADLAEEVGASRRTVLRDIRALRAEGFPIHTEPGRGGGVQLDSRSAQRSGALTVLEIFALIISVSSMRASGKLPFSGLADSGLAKIERSLKPEEVRDLRQLLDCLYVGQLSPQVDISEMSSIDPELLPAFETAFLHRMNLRFQYRDSKGQVSMRSVEPQAMLILLPLWYLVAWDPERDDFRHFRMDRISEIECLENTRFQRRHVAFEDKVSPIRDFTR